MQVNDKIKVFISSKCGGEHINFNQFIDNSSIKKKQLVENAIKTDYDLIRRALKLALEETGIIDVYIFEDDSASTKIAEEDYCKIRVKSHSDSGVNRTPNPEQIAHF